MHTLSNFNTVAGQAYIQTIPVTRILQSPVHWIMHTVTNLTHRDPRMLNVLGARLCITTL